MDCRSLIRRSAAFFAERTAVIHGERRLTFNQAWQRGLRFANALLARGLRPGDRVAVLEDNSVEAADFFLGTTAANLVRVPLYPRNSRAAHRYMLEHTGCRALVVSGRYAADVEPLRGEVASLEHLIVRDEGYERWLAGYPDSDPAVPVMPEDNTIIRHTGGTTGMPKGVAYTHKAWLAAGRDWFYLFPPVMPGDRCLHLGPISHGSGYFFVPMWLAGGCNVLLDQFEPTNALEVMQTEKIAYMFLVPTMLNMLNQAAASGTREFPHLKCMQIGGAPITDATALGARAVFGDRLWQGYGQTEAVPITMMGPQQWFAEVEGSEPLRACGMPLPFADLEIWDENNTPLPTGEAGQIVVRCDGQMSGFWEDPEATRARLSDGWVLSGDVGRVDANGYVYMLDRAGDMIISGGYNIYPAELENVLTSHPGVIEAAVFGVPDARWGESPTAVCTVDGNTPVSEEALIELCVNRLGSYKKPGRVVLQKEPLPKSPVGKIRRKALREPYWEGRDRRVGGS